MLHRRTWVCVVTFSTMTTETWWLSSWSWPVPLKWLIQDILEHGNVSREVMFFRLIIKATVTCGEVTIFPSDSSKVHAHNILCYYCFHFTSEETDSERLSLFLKATQNAESVKGRDGITRRKQRAPGFCSWEIIATLCNTIWEKGVWCSQRACVGYIESLKIPALKSKALVPQSFTPSGAQFFTKVLKVKWGYLGVSSLEWGPLKKTKAHRHREGHRKERTIYIRQGKRP